MDTGDLGILITNIKSETGEDNIRELFSSYGKINYMKILPDKFNEGSNICYMKFENEDCAKQAVQSTDKSQQFGGSIRVSLKKIVFKDRSNEQNGDRPRNNNYNSSENGDRPRLNFRNSDNNGDRPRQNFRQSSDNDNTSSFRNGDTEQKVVRNPSSHCGTGRGRGFSKNGVTAPGLTTGDTHLNPLNIPKKEQIAVEIVELKCLNSILVRPLNQTDKSKSEIDSILSILNNDASQLEPVVKPTVGCHYMAQWQEDNNFYRAKILEIVNNEYKVCFVDEGNSGDIVKNIKEIPKNLQNFPCQFIECSLNVCDSPEFIHFILKESNDKIISIAALSGANEEDLYNINMFIGDNEVVSKFNKEGLTDLREKPYPKEIEIKSHKVNTEHDNFQVIQCPQNKNDSYKLVIMTPHSSKPRMQPLFLIPLEGDLVIYKQSDESLHRAVVQTLKFTGSQFILGLKLIDEDRSVEAASLDQLMSATADSLDMPPCVINCLLDTSSEPPSDGKICIVAHNNKDNMYVIKSLPTQRHNHKDGEGNDLTGRTFDAVISHMESAAEFYFQIVEESNLLMGLDEQLMNYNGARIRAGSDIQPGQLVVAPFLGTLYRAKVIKVNTNTAAVLFIDYGNSEVVSVSDIMESSKSLSSVKNLAHKAKLSLNVKPNSESAVTDLLLEYTSNNERMISVKVDRMEDNFAVISFSTAEKSPFNDIVKFKELVEPDQVFVTPTKKFDGENTAKTSTEEVNLNERVWLLEERIRKLEQHVRNT